MSNDHKFRVTFTKVTLEYFEVIVDVRPSGAGLEYSAEQYAKVNLKKNPKHYQFGANHVAWITTGIREI